MVGCAVLNGSKSTAFAECQGLTLLEFLGMGQVSEGRCAAFLYFGIKFTQK